MKTWKTLVAITLGLGLSADALAQCCHGKDNGEKTAVAKAAADGGGTCQKDKSTCNKDGTASKAQCEGKSLAATGMPLMQYKVGEQTTQCPKQAAELAANDESKIRYVVGTEEYTDKVAALNAYAKVLDGYLATMTSVRFAVGGECVNCPLAAAELAKKSGDSVKYRVGTVAFVEKTAAEKAAERAQGAAKQVTMKMVVDGKTVTCAQDGAKTCQGQNGTCHAKDGEGKAAAADAKGSCHGAAKDCEYVVGDVKTRCAATAKVELAKARILAAQKAIAETATGHDQIAAGA